MAAETLVGRLPRKPILQGNIMSNEFADIDIPTQMTIRKNSHHLQITRKWFEIKYVILAPIVMTQYVFLFFVYTTIFSAPKIDMVAVLVAVLYASLVVILTYGILAGFYNKTTIDVTFNMTSVKDYPLSFWENKRIASKEILQLYCKKKKMRNGLWWHDLISIHAIMNNKNDITLLSRLKTIEQALFIKQEIHSFLNIKNETVKDEINNIGKLFF